MFFFLCTSPSSCCHVLCFLWSVDVRVSSLSVLPRLIVLHPSIQLGQTLTASVLLEKALNHICSSELFTQAAIPKWGFAAFFSLHAGARKCWDICPNKAEPVSQRRLRCRGFSLLHFSVCVALLFLNFSKVRKSEGSLWKSWMFEVRVAGRRVLVESSVS